MLKRWLENMDQEGEKVWVNFELKCETTCVCNNITKLFGSARVKAKDVIVPDDCLGS